MNWAYCEDCLRKQRRINELEEEIRLLKTRLRYQERTAAEGPFGSLTLSSKIPLKANTDSERKTRRGGAKAGHKGHGRSSFEIEEADRVERISAEKFCPDCGELLKSKGVRSRTVLECRPVEVEKVVYHLERKVCPRCGKKVQGRPQGGFAKEQVWKRTFGARGNGTLRARHDARSPCGANAFRTRMHR